MAKKLYVKFNCEGDATKNLSFQDPVLDLEAETIEDFATTVINNHVFNTDGKTLSSLAKAYYSETVVEDIYPEEE